MAVFIPHQPALVLLFLIMQGDQLPIHTTQPPPMRQGAILQARRNLETGGRDVLPNVPQHSKAVTRPLTADLPTSRADRSYSQPSQAYVHHRSARNTFQPAFLQPQAPLNPYALPVSSAQSLGQPRTVPTDPYHQPYPVSSANVQSRGTIHHMPGGSYPPAQPSSGPTRTYHITPPSFPFFSQDEPWQFVMLKMALSNLLPPEESEQLKYHILLDHLKLDNARHLALAYAHHPLPFTRAMAALQQRYGQPQQLVIKEIASILNLPVRPGDSRSFGDFAISV